MSKLEEMQKLDRLRQQLEVAGEAVYHADTKLYEMYDALRSTKEYEIHITLESGKGFSTKLSGAALLDGAKRNIDYHKKKLKEVEEEVARCYRELLRSEENLSE